MKLILSSDKDKFLDFSVDLIKLKKSERLKVCIKKFSLFFLLAAASVFIPVLHFFLVPVFLIISFYVGFKAYLTQYHLKLPSGCRCIECQKPLKADFLLDEDLRIKCESCFSHYLIDTKS